jgi:hypothetical protein
VAPLAAVRAAGGRLRPRAAEPPAVCRGPAEVAELIERKRLKKQRKAWKKKHKTLAKTPDPTACVRVHPAMTLEQILKDPRMVVANFLVTLLVIPDKHPAHEAYLKEHKWVGVLQPEGTP